MKAEVKFLKNGIPVLMNHMDSINTVSLGIFVKTGTKNELPGEEGISHFLEHMLFKGTTTRSAKEISEEIDNEGANINAYTSRETTVYYVQMLSSKIGKGIEILSDMVLNSTFTKENLDKERNVIIEEIRMYEDIPEEIIHEENIRLTIDGPQGKNILGTEESLNKIDREVLVKYFKETYIPENIVVSIAGNLDEEKIFKQLDETLGTLESTNKVREFNEKMKINNSKNIISQPANQVHVCINTLGTSVTDQDRYAAAIISNVLGGNMSSRLFQKIREERGLAYSVYSYSSSFEEGGLFTVYAGTTKKDYLNVIEMVKEEFENIKEHGITEYELQKSKNQFLSGFTFALETSKGMMNRMANSYMSFNKIISIDESIREIENLKLEDIKRTAEKLFDDEYYSYTILGNI